MATRAKTTSYDDFTGDNVKGGRWKRIKAGSAAPLSDYAWTQDLQEGNDYQGVSATSCPGHGQGAWSRLQGFCGENDDKDNGGGGPSVRSEAKSQRTTRTADQ